MKKFIIIMMSFFAINSLQSQINTIVFDSVAQKDILIGECNQEGLNSPPFNEFYTREYGSYSPSPEIISEIINRDKNYKILIIMASWCGDSQEQVPRFLKIADDAGFSRDKIRIICVNKGKKATGFEEILDKIVIERVPTFVFYSTINENLEIGRIVETPHETLEMDWLKIIENL